MLTLFLSLVIFAFSVPVYATSYVSVLKCSGEAERFELFLDRENTTNALYSLKPGELYPLTDLKSRRLNVITEKGDETFRLALSYAHDEDSLVYNDITKKLELKIADHSASLDCTPTTNSDQEIMLYKLYKL